MGEGSLKIDEYLIQFWLVFDGILYWITCVGPVQLKRYGNIHLVCWIFSPVGFVAFASHADSDTDDSEKFTFFWLSDSPFSQWYSCRFTIDGTEYNCAEQYMMQKKACEFMLCASLFSLQNMHIDW